MIRDTIFLAYWRALAGMSGALGRPEPTVAQAARAFRLTRCPIEGSRLFIGRAPCQRSDA